MGRSVEQPLIEGNVFRTITLFALPMLLGNMLQQAYNIVDTWVVGQYIGTGALAGVGSVYTLMTFLTSILIGLSMGSSVVFALHVGAREPEKLRRSVANAFALIGAATALLSAAAICGRDGILRWMQIPQEIYGETSTYLRIVLWGLPVIFLYNFFAAYLKSLGNSAVPLYFLGVSTVMNIVLDLVLVIALHQGVAGAAWGTVLAQSMAGLGITVYVLRRHPQIRQALCHIRPSLEEMRRLAGYSVFTCLQQSVMNLGILMVQGLVNSFGTTIMAAFAAAVKIDSFAYMPAQEYANAFSTFTAQNIGAGRHDRVKKGIRCSVTTSLVYCAAVSAVMWFAADSLMGLFVHSAERAVIAEGVRYLHIEGTFYWAIGLLFIFYGLYRAVGKPYMSLVLTVISLGTRVLLAYVLSDVPSIGVVGIWWAIPIGWWLADLTGYVYGKKSKIEALRR